MITDKTFYGGEQLDMDVTHDSSILHSVTRLKNGKVVGEFRFMCSVTVEGKEYHANEVFRVALKEGTE